MEKWPPICEAGTASSASAKRHRYSPSSLGPAATSILACQEFQEKCQQICANAQAMVEENSFTMKVDREVPEWHRQVNTR